jgi:putative endonuclease
VSTRLAEWLRRLFRRGGRTDSGLWGERQAEALLRRKGFRVLGRRVRVGRRDEIDLLARDGDVLVFVEVKTRAREAYGRPASAVHAHKRRVLSRAAVRYIKTLGRRQVLFRFDVVEVVGAPGGADPVLRHIANAFPLDARYTLPA